MRWSNVFFLASRNMWWDHRLLFEQIWLQETQKLLLDKILHWLQEVSPQSWGRTQGGNLLVSRELLFYLSYKAVHCDEGTLKHFHVFYPVMRSWEAVNTWCGVCGVNRQIAESDWHIKEDFVGYFQQKISFLGNNFLKFHNLFIF